MILCCGVVFFNCRMNVKSTLILLPLLGLTWVFGLFAIDSNTTVFAWLFTISNSIQVFVIYYMHNIAVFILLNSRAFSSFSSIF